MLTKLSYYENKQHTIEFNLNRSEKTSIKLTKTSQI